MNFLIKYDKLYNLIKKLLSSTYFQINFDNKHAKNTHFDYYFENELFLCN